MTRRTAALVFVLLVPAAALAAHPARADQLSVVTDYFTFGMDHLWGGWDHLAFLACLFLPGGRVSRLVKVITAFTLAHTLTLALAASGTVFVEARWVEPFIAGSIVWVAAAYFRRSGDEGRAAADPRLAWALGFGLVHGLGFAGALEEIGLAPGRFVESLVGFNLGLEAAQVLTVTLALPLLGWVEVWRPQVHRLLVRTGVGAAGCLGLWWFLERVARYFL